MRWVSMFVVLLFQRVNPKAYSSVFAYGKSTFPCLGKVKLRWVSMLVVLLFQRVNRKAYSSVFAYGKSTFPFLGKVRAQRALPKFTKSVRESTHLLRKQNNPP